MSERNVISLVAFFSVFLILPPAVFAGEKKLHLIGAMDPGASLTDHMVRDLMRVTPDDFTIPRTGKAVSLMEAVMVALRNNPDIKVAAHGPFQAETHVMQAKSVYDPVAFADWQHSRNKNPDQIGYQRVYDNEYRSNTERAGVRQHLPTGGDLTAYREWNQAQDRNIGSPTQEGHGGAYILEFSQPLLTGFADQENRTIISLSRLQVDISEEDFRRVVINTMADLIETYWNVALATEEIAIHEETVVMAQRLLEREDSRKRQGISTPLDVHRAREAYSTRINNLFYAKEQYQTAQERLKLYLGQVGRSVDGSLIDLSASEQLAIPLVAVDLQTSIDTALASRPEMRNAEVEIHMSEQRKRYARHNLLPKVDATGSVRRNDRNSSTPAMGSTNDLRGTDWNVGFSFSMPLGNMEARASLLRATSELDQRLDEKKNVKSVIITEVRSAVKTLEYLVREIPINEHAVQAAQGVVKGEWARLELNQVGNRDLLQAQDLLAMARRNRVQTMTRYNIALARLFAVEGSLLDRMGIHVK